MWRRAPPAQVDLQKNSCFIVRSASQGRRHISRMNFGLSRRGKQVVQQHVDWDWLRDSTYELPEPESSEQGKFSLPQVERWERGQS